MTKSLFYLLSLLKPVYTLRLHVVGISSGLGRELAYQALINYDDLYITGMCSSPDNQSLKFPYRDGGLSDKDTKIPPFKSKRLKLFSYNVDEFCKSVYNDYDAVIFTTSGTAFEKYDFSDEITKQLIKSIPVSCKFIQCVSAYGVEDNWTSRINNQFEKVGIQGMKDFYLKEVYRSKLSQEKILKNFTKYNNVELDIIRPKVLSFGETNNLCATSRESLASQMLDKLYKCTI